MRCKRILSVLLLLLFFAGSTSCKPPDPNAAGNQHESGITDVGSDDAGDNTSAVTTTAVPVPSEPPLTILSMQIIANPATDPKAIDDPSSLIGRSLIDAYHPTAEDLLLYNDAFRAVVNHADSLDLTGYDMPFEEKAMTCELLYGETSFRLPYLMYIRYNDDGTSALFTYNDMTTEEIAYRIETESARLGQLIYNVPPEGASDIVRYAAIFDYLCRTSDYSPDMSDEKQMGPDSILINHTGICWGFATLLTDIFPSVGLDGIYVANEAHAWNQIVLDGKRYHTDVTFGVGSFESDYNTFETFLMDDKAREESLSAAGVAFEDVHTGIYSNTPTAAPACLDTTYEVYQHIHGNYALDADNGKIYINDSGGIKSMNIDTTGLRTLTKKTANVITVYRGVIYFLATDDSLLYRLVPGEDPELFGGDDRFTALTLDGATLCAAKDSEDGETKRFPLVPDAAAIETAGELRQFGETTVERDGSYYFTVQFSDPVSDLTDIASCVVLTDDGGAPLAAHFNWNADRTLLTVRPFESIDEYKKISLYVLAGIGGTTAAPLEETQHLDVSVHSAADA